MDYCTVSDVYATQPPGSFSNPGRLIASIANGVFELDNHGFAVNDAVTFEGQLPPGIVRGTVYRVVPLGDNFFEVVGIVGLDYDGYKVLVVRPLPWSDWIKWASRLIDEFIPHLLPLAVPTPEIVKHTCADLVAQKGLQFVGGTDIDINTHITNAQTTLLRWAKSVPLRGNDRPKNTNVGAVVGSSTRLVDARGWRRNAI